MVTIKYLKYLLPGAFLPLLFLKVSAQNFDKKTYLHKMQLMDSLSMYKMQDYDTLFHVAISQNFHGTDYKDDYYGWVIKRSTTGISPLGGSFGANSNLSNTHDYKSGLTC